MREIAMMAEDLPDYTDRRAAAAVADELVALTAVLSDLAYDLGSDPDTLRRHMGSLQSIDLITQIHLALADVLRSSDPLPERIECVTVEALAQRLREKLLAGAQ